MDLNEVLNGTEEINVALFTSIKDITAGYGLADRPDQYRGNQSFPRNH